MKYEIRAHETGDVIDEFDTLEDAQDAMSQYIYEDKREGIYARKFYEIYTEEEGIIEIA